MYLQPFDNKSSITPFTVGMVYKPVLPIIPIDISTVNISIKNNYKFDKEQINSLKEYSI